MIDVYALSPADRLHVFHAFEQAGDTHEIDRPHIDACVRLGAMEKTGRRFWEFTSEGDAAARALETLWSAGQFDMVTGDISPHRIQKDR